MKPSLFATAWDWNVTENRNVLFVPNKLGESAANSEGTGDL